MLALMKHAISTKGCTYSVLDVRNSKLYVHERDMDSLMPLVEGEARALELILGRI